MFPKQSSKKLTGDVRNKYLLFSMLLGLFLVSVFSLGKPTLFPIVFGCLFITFVVFPVVYPSADFFAIYYSLLCSIYFIVPYGWLLITTGEYTLATIQAKWIVALVLLLPFALVLPFIVRKSSRVIEFVKVEDKATLIFLSLIVFVSFHFFSSVSERSILGTRDYLGFVVYFTLGFLVTLDLTKFVRYVLGIGVILLCFGLLELYLGKSFWLGYFPGQFVFDVKSSGSTSFTVRPGFSELAALPVSKVSTFPFLGRPFRLSSFFVYPKYTFFNFLILAIVSWSFIKNRVFKTLVPILFIVGALLTLTKAAWLLVGLTVCIFLGLKKGAFRRYVLEKQSIIRSFLAVVALYLVSYLTWEILALIKGSYPGIAHFRDLASVYEQSSWFHLLFGHGFESPVFRFTGDRLTVYSSHNGLAQMINNIGVFGSSLFYLGVLAVVNVLLKNGLEAYPKFVRGVYAFAVGWLVLIPWVGSTFSPIGVFLPFFMAGLIYGKTEKS